MTRSDVATVLAYLRLSQLPRYAQRVLALPAVKADDFTIDPTPAQRLRLEAIAAAVRGAASRPAIFVHGILPRSGTNFLSDALALHPDVHAHPGRLWEFPLLYVATSAVALQQEFLIMFKRNREVMERYDIFGYLASGWLAALQGEAGERRILLKSPHMQNITLFRHVFPNDTLLLCLRDGRDVIQSSLRTFGRVRPGRKGVAELAREWRYGTEAVLSFEVGGANAYPKALVVRYENLVQSPEITMREILAHANLDPWRYDFQALARLPVRGSSSVRASDHDRWAQRAKDDSFQPIGRWTGWSAARKRKVKALAGETLIRAGYAADDRW
jgi:protein-tyrosine sulfotransferase